LGRQKDEEVQKRESRLTLNLACLSHRDEKKGVKSGRRNRLGSEARKGERRIAARKILPRWEKKERREFKKL